MEQVRIQCTCTIENFDQTGAVLRKQLMKKSSLELGRSEFGDVVIKLSCPDGKQGDCVCVCKLNTADESYYRN